MGSEENASLGTEMRDELFLSMRSKHPLTRFTCWDFGGSGWEGSVLVVVMLVKPCTLLRSSLASKSVQSERPKSKEIEGRAIP